MEQNYSQDWHWNADKPSAALNPYITLPRICVESVSSALLKHQHLPCDCEWKSHNSEGVFRQLYADAWPRDHGWGHDVEMAGDEFLRWQVESKDEV